MISSDNREQHPEKPAHQIDLCEVSITRSESRTEHISLRDLAEKLGTETRKLRLVLYSLAKKEAITLEPGESRVNGMTVSPA